MSICGTHDVAGWCEFDQFLMGRVLSHQLHRTRDRIEEGADYTQISTSSTS